MQRLSIQKRARPGAVVNKNSDRIFLVYLQAYFVTIATILGTGILGLPVTLAHSGLYPFLISFLGGAFVQALLVYFFTELLQLAHVELNHGTKEEMVPLNDLEDDAGYVASDEDGESSDGVEKFGVEVKENKHHDSSVKTPNLHLMGKLFLGSGLRQMFDIILILQFVGLLISYALAGSEAYAQLIGIEHIYIIPVFVWTLTFAVVFALQYIQPVVSVLTFFKGSLLLGTVIVTFFVGSEINRTITNDFNATGGPFLMGTVALGGVINTMPLMYSKIKPVKQQVQNFRMSVLLGLLTCTILNILWCWAVLDIVPQLTIHPCGQSNQSVILYTQENIQYCHSNISLESAAKAGEISTIPLTQIIERDYPTFFYIAVLVELFIIVSITVSYLTVGAVLHHTVTGWLDTVWSSRYKVYDTSKVYTRPKKCCSSYFLCKTFLSLALFSIVFMVAMLDPEGFVDMLETFASLTINLESGFFVFLMLWSAGKHYKAGYAKIPLTIPGWAQGFKYVIPVYFGTAVVYDIYNAIHKIVLEYLPDDFNSTNTFNNYITAVTTSLVINSTKSNISYV